MDASPQDKPLQYPHDSRDCGQRGEEYKTLPQALHEIRGNHYHTPQREVADTPSMVPASTQLRKNPHGKGVG